MRDSLINFMITFQMYNDLNLVTFSQTCYKMILICIIDEHIKILLPRFIKKKKKKRIKEENNKKREQGPLI